VEMAGLKWYGHIMQMEEEWWPKRIHKLIPPGNQKERTIKETGMKEFYKPWLEEDWNQRMYKTRKSAILGWQGSEQLHKFYYYYHHHHHHRYYFELSGSCKVAALHCNGRIAKSCSDLYQQITTESWKPSQ
jgi:predicted NodU family carbamoyl transferase